MPYYKIGDKYYSVETNQQYKNPAGAALPTFAETTAEDIRRNLGTGYENLAFADLEKPQLGQDKPYVQSLDPASMKVTQNPSFLPGIGAIAEGDFGYAVLPQGILPGQGAGTPQSTLAQELQADQTKLAQQRIQPQTLGSLNDSYQEQQARLNAQIPKGTPGYQAVFGGDATLTGQQIGGNFMGRTFARIGNDVFETTNGQQRPITPQEFEQTWKPQGLNLDVLPQMQAGGTGGQTGTQGGTTGQIGGQGGVPEAPQKTTKDFKTLFESNLSSSGASSIKAEAEKYVKEYADIKNELDDKIKAVNDNPWLSEAARSKSVSSLQSRYQDRLETALTQQKLFNTLYQEAVNNAKFETEGEFNQYQFDVNTALKMEQLAIDKAEAISKLTEINPANFKEVNGGLFDIKSNKWIVPPKATGTGDMSSKDLSNFISITTRFQADPLINNALKGQTAIAIADQVIANPGSAANQLKALYSLVKNLDPDSAVREGEIGLADRTQSYLQRFENSFTNITEGRVISPDAAVALAKATKELAGAWADTAKRREGQYKAQSSVAGIGEPFNNYLNQASLFYNSGQRNVDIPPEDKTAQLDAIVGEDEDEGFFSGILDVFGLKFK